MAMNILHNCKTQLTNLVQNIDEGEDSAKISEVNSKNESIKKLQEEYADSYSKNQNIKMNL